MAVADVFYEDGGEVGGGMAAVKALKGWEILNHWTMGWPTMTLPKSSVPLLAGRMAVPVPVRLT